MDKLKREQAYEKLRDAITYGDLKPGERLVESDVCNKFDVGRTPLREALRQLQMEGYLDVSPNKGAIIRKITVEELEAVYDVLAQLEGYAVEMATGVLTSKDIKALKGLLSKLDRASKSKDFDQWFALNASFHGYFQNSSGNPILKEEIEKLRNRIYRYRSLAFSLAGSIVGYLNDHEKIYQYVLDRDPARARGSMEKHLKNTKKILADFTRENSWI